MTRPIALAAILLTTSTAGASPFTLQIDPLQSDVDVTLCMTVLGSTRCDSDNSPLGGSFDLALDCLTTPEYVTLHDFVLEVTQSTELLLDFGFLGKFEGSTSGVTIMYATPGTPMPATPLVAGAFSYAGVPIEGTGYLDYSATMAVCLGLQAAGYLCVDAIDLSTLQLDPIDFDATLSIVDRDVTMTMDIAMIAPLNPDFPDLGYFSIEGALVALGTVPPWQYPIGDLDGNDVVDLADFAWWVPCLAGPDELAQTGCLCSDLNQDGDVDLGDFAVLQAALPTP
jgi:hypothetical protein